MAQPPYFMGDYGNSRQDLPLDIPYDSIHQHYEDPTSVAYIPRAARAVPQAHTVHTIYVKKVTHPLSTSPDELWILETNSDGLERWRSIESFLGSLHLSQDPRTLRAVANQWRFHYDVQPVPNTAPSDSLHPVLPHPEHSTVFFGQPVSAIPDHSSILQACWGRSAHRHSQGAPTSLFWPPTRNTHPASPSRLLLRQRTTTTSAPTTTPPPHPGPPHSGVSSNADMSDSSV